MTRERRSHAESKNCEILMFPTAVRRFGTKVKCPTGRASCWVKFPTVRSLTRVKCPGIARGGMGGFGIDWYITSPSASRGLLHNKLHIAEEVVVDHKLISFFDGGSCSLPVFLDDSHGFSSEIASLKTEERSVSFELCCFAV